MPAFRYIRLVGLRLHAVGGRARQLGQASFPQLAEAVAQRFAPSLLPRSVAA